MKLVFAFFAGSCLVLLAAAVMPDNVAGSHGYEPWRVGRYSSQAFPAEHLVYVTDTVTGQVITMEPLKVQKYPEMVQYGFTGVVPRFDSFMAVPKIAKPR
jgi:hypothetical protein